MHATTHHRQYGSSSHRPRLARVLIIASYHLGGGTAIAMCKLVIRCRRRHAPLFVSNYAYALRQCSACARLSAAHAAAEYSGLVASRCA